MHAPLINKITTYENWKLFSDESTFDNEKSDDLVYMKLIPDELLAVVAADPKNYKFMRALFDLQINAMGCRVTCS